MMLRLPLAILAVLALFSLASSAPTGRNAHFLSLYGLTKNKRDFSGRPGDPGDKYFHESTFHPHYDGRFAEKPLGERERNPYLVALIQTYLSTMHDIGAETWIMHGSLLGWWWNKKVMPWDSDADVQISEDSMQYLASYYNMTVHNFKLPGIKGGRKYLIEVNPHWVNSSTADKMNVIDARWIDTESGLFIDITTLRRDRDAEANGLRGQMMCKDRHRYREDQIFPLRDSTFEGMPVKVPFAYTELLQQEYGPASLTKKNYQNHHFDESVMEWLPLYKLSPSGSGGLLTVPSSGRKEKGGSRPQKPSEALGGV